MSKRVSECEKVTPLIGLGFSVGLRVEGFMKEDELPSIDEASDGIRRRHVDV